MAYKARTILNGFAATALPVVPFDSDRVYQQLTFHLRTPTPPPSQSSNSHSSCLQVFRNLRQFERQLSTIKKRISQRKLSPLESIDQVTNRISKAYERSIS
jgi:hypothetical protein